jgi:hypothetical protein
MWEIFSLSGIATTLAPPRLVSDESFVTAVRDGLIKFEIPQAGLPTDFNPIHYLQVNPDLLKARVNPYRHYLDWGKRENRSYSISGTVQ